MTRNFVGPWRALDEQEIAELRRRRDAGWRAKALAEAYGISVRTVWRYLLPGPSAATVGLRHEIDRWAREYALALRPQERDALVAAITRRHTREETRAAA